MKRTWFTSLLLLLTLIVSILGYSVSQVRAVESQGVGAVPANPRSDNPRSSSIFVYTKNAGATISDAVKIINNTEQTKTVSVYPVDSVASSDGAFACAQAVDNKKDVGSWIKMSSEEVSVQSFAKKNIPFTISIPDNASPGEHNGCIVIQDTNQQRQTSENGIVLSFRSAIRVAITVPGEIQSNLVLDKVNQDSTGNKLRISPEYRNEGNVSVDADINVKLKTLFGNTIRESGGEFPILADTTSKFNFEVDKPFWGGIYRRDIATSYIKLASQGDDAETQNLSINRSYQFITPQPIALFTELFTLLVVAYVASRIYRRKKDVEYAASHGHKHTVSQGDNIQSVAKKYGVAWKTLARVNKLKAPYALHKGQVLKIPRNRKKKTKK